MSGQDPMSEPCRIVLAEDNPGDVGLVRRALHEHAVTCDLRVLTDGEEVLSFFADLDQHVDRPCPDLLLLDLYLPKLDGSEVLKQLRASQRCARTKVVVLSSLNAPLHYQIAEHNGAVRFFEKPTSLGRFMDLGKIVKEVLAAA